MDSIYRAGCYGDEMMVMMSMAGHHGEGGRPEVKEKERSSQGGWKRRLGKKNDFSYALPTSRLFFSKAHSQFKDALINIVMIKYGKR